MTSSTTHIVPRAGESSASLRVHGIDGRASALVSDDEEQSRESPLRFEAAAALEYARRTPLLTADGSISKHLRLSLSRPSGHAPRRRAHCSVGRRTTRLAARGGRLHRPGDPRAGPRDADVTGRATASVGHRTAASRGETNGRAARTQAASWHDRSHYSGVVVPAMPMPRIGSSAPSQQAVLCTRF
jgi:hypothetical protein